MSAQKAQWMPLCGNALTTRVPRGNCLSPNGGKGDSPGQRPVYANPNDPSHERAQPPNAIPRSHALAHAHALALVHSVVSTKNREHILASEIRDELPPASAALSGASQDRSRHAWPTERS
jgi:hypothetical protein